MNPAGDLGVSNWASFLIHSVRSRRSEKFPEASRRALVQNYRAVLDRAVEMKLKRIAIVELTKSQRVDAVPPRTRVGSAARSLPSWLGGRSPHGSMRGRVDAVGADCRDCFDG